MDTRVSTQLKSQLKQVGYEEKTAAVHDEMKRMNRLPANSTYATHRLRVLNKIQQLMSIQSSDIGKSFIRNACTILESCRLYLRKFKGHCIAPRKQGHQSQA
ncbi:hypothetical protein SO802_014887 [Lithocarpus litseifolius]|uniref:Uncharacterized protein n=1 Tax=Lithocarpus litseifolius TaxID=425828 RepID=A0AAW2CSG9_9ROSI